MTKTSKSQTASKPTASTVSKTAAAEKLGKTQLIDLVADRTKISKKDAGLLVSATLDVIVESLKSGKSVGLPGLGTFSVKATSARTGVRPGTNEKIVIAAGKKVSYKVASDLKASL